MTERNIGQEILDGIREIKAYKRGEGELRIHTLSDPSPPRQIRERLGLSQSAFASLMGVSLRTVQAWERGQRRPQGSARALLRVAEQHPEAFTAVK